METGGAIAKKTPKKSFVFLTISLLLSVFTIIESSMDSSLSELQSDFVSNIGAFLVNLFGSDTDPEVVEPRSLSVTNDSSFLGEGIIARGSSSRLSFLIEYPDGEAYNQAFSVERTVGTEDDYSYVVSQGSLSNGSLPVYVNIIGYSVGEYSITATAGEGTSITYDFEVVDLVTPKEFYLAELPPSTMEVGESFVLPIYLTDSSGLAASRAGVDAEDSSEEALELVDHYLRRVYDAEAIPQGSYGQGLLVESNVVTALETGTYTGYIGEGENIQEFTIQVIDGEEPSSDASIALSSEGESYVNDYDYTLAAEGYGTLVSADLSGLPEGTVVNFELDEGDDLYARIKRVSDTEALVLGYRLAGEVSLTVSVAGYPEISATMDIDVTRAVPKGMALNVSGNQTISVGSTLNVTATYEPLNAEGGGLYVTDYDDTMVSISGEGTGSLSIRALSIGTTSVTVTCGDNPDLSVTISLTIIARAAINEENSSDFASWMRKSIGHFAVFFFTGLFAFLGLFYLFYDMDFKKRVVLSLMISLGFCLLIGGLSELIQLFVPGRGSSIADVGLDVAGATLGIVIPLLVYLGIYFYRVFRKKKP